MLTGLFLRMLNREAASPKRGAARILGSLQLAEGMTVADIGSGGGYFALAFARRVGARGRVYAVDSRPKSLEFVKRQAAEAGLTNIEFLVAERNGVALPEASLDLIFARNVFHHLAEPEAYFRSLRRALKPAGTVAVIEHAPARGVGFVRLFRHFTAPERIRTAMEAAGYRLSASLDFLPAQTFTVWCRADGGRAAP